MAELYVKSMSSGKKFWMGEKEDGKRGIKPKIEVKTEADDQDHHRSPIDNTHQLPPNAPISHPLNSVSVGFPLATSSPIPPALSTVSAVAQGQAMINGGDSMTLEVPGDKEAVANASNELPKLKEAGLAKERESQVKDRLLELLESKDAMIAMWKEKSKQQEDTIAQLEKRSVVATTLESAVQTDPMENAKETPPTEQLSRAARAAQLLGVPLDILEPPNEWKDKCEQLEHDLEAMKQLYRAEQKTNATLRGELLKMGRKVQKEAVEDQPTVQLDDAELTEMVTSPLDPVQLEGQQRRQKQQLKRMREGNVAAINASLQSVASGDEQRRENDGNVLVIAEKRAKKTTTANLINVVSGSFPCVQCPHHVAFASAELLEQHQQRRHSYHHRYPCDQCAQSFTKIGDLNVHKKGVHGGLKPFSCTICDKSFAKKADLKRHERVHTGERPFICDVCQKAFAQSSDLRNHLRVHTGEKRFCCQHCGRKFAKSGDCRQHQNICAQHNE